MATTYLGTLSGPNYFASSYDERSIELHASLLSAINSMLDRRISNGQYGVKVAFLNGETTDTIYPVFGEGTSLTLYQMKEDFDPEDEGDVDEALTAVHCGVPDNVITLTADGGVDVNPYGYEG